MKSVLRETNPAEYPRCPLCHNSWHGLANSLCRGVYNMDVKEPPLPFVTKLSYPSPAESDNSIPRELAWIAAGVIGGTLMGLGAAAYSFKRAINKVFGKDPEVLSRG